MLVALDDALLIEGDADELRALANDLLEAAVHGRVDANLPTDEGVLVVRITRTGEPT